MRTTLRNVNPLEQLIHSRVSVGRGPGDCHALFMKVNHRSVTVHTDRASLVGLRDMLNQYLDSPEGTV